jgi:hypothetical protein
MKLRIKLPEADLGDRLSDPKEASKEFGRSQNGIP